MILTKETLQHPEVKSHTTIKVEDDLGTIENVDEVGNWLFAMVCVALEQPQNREYLEYLKEVWQS